MYDSFKLSFLSISSSAVLGISLLIYRFISPKKKFNLFVLLVLISILPVISIFRAGSYQAGDLSLHSALLQSFYSNLTQGNIFPQWAGDICGGYGCPAHMFEYPLPYYIASIFHFLGFNYLNSIKILLAFSFVSSGIVMYLWLKTELGELAAFVGSLFYLFAPYHLEDLHFRVSVGEVLSFTLLPLVFLFIKLFMNTKKPIHFILLAFSVGLLIMAHGNTLMSAGPLMLLYILFLLQNSKDKIKDLLTVCLSMIFGFLLTAFYWIPTLLEIKYTWYVLSQFRISDFKPFYEYVFSPIRLGFLFQGHAGELRLIIGYLHLFLIFCAFYLLYEKRILKSHKTFLIVLLVSFFVYFFMMLEVSRPIWEILPFFKSFSFPWRLLLPMSFVTSIIAAIVVRSFKNKKIIYFISFFVVMTTILNWGNRQMVPFDQASAFYSHIWGYSKYFDSNDSAYKVIYKARVAKEAEIVRNRPKEPLEFLKGAGSFVSVYRKNISHEYILNTTENSTLVENLNYFPGWNLYVDDRPYKLDYQNKMGFGKIVFSLPKGTYLVRTQFEDTRVRETAKLISLFSFLILLTFIPNVA